MKRHSPSHLLHRMAFPESLLLQMMVDNRCIVEKVACQVWQIFQDPFTNVRLCQAAIIAGCNGNLRCEGILFEVDVNVVFAISMYITD